MKKKVLLGFGIVFVFACSIGSSLYFQHLNNREKVSPSTSQVQEDLSSQRSVHSENEGILNVAKINEDMRKIRLENYFNQIEIEKLAAEEEKLAEEARQLEEKQKVETEQELEKTTSKSQNQFVENSQKEKIVEKKPQVVIPKSTLPMTEYLLSFAHSEERVETTTHIMIHFTSNALHKPNNPYLIEDIYNIFNSYGISVHYVIGRAGEIYQMTPEDRVAYHAGQGRLKGFPEYDLRLNHYSIGIELLAIGTREEMIPIIKEENFNKIDPSLIGYTEAQYSTLNTLINDIIVRNPEIKRNRSHIVGHDEYLPGKTDPGRLFEWSKIGL